MDQEKGSRKSEIRSFIEECHKESWSFLKTLTAEDAGVTLYQDNDYQWTVHTLVSHLADSERGMVGQAQRAVAGQTTVPEDFDLERWNRGVARKSASKAIPEFLNQILDAHKNGLGFLAGLDDAQLDIQGRHASGEMLSVEGFLRRIAQHRLDHVQDVKKVLDQ
jgi:hypothetical protein